MAAKPSLSTDADIKSANADKQGLNASDGIAARIQSAAAKKSWKQADLAAASGVAPKRISEYWTAKREPGAANLVAIAVALGVSAEWLALGRVPLAPNHLVDAAEAEFVYLPRFDLREISDTGKGGVVEAVPFRRDWLFRKLYTSSGLWLAELPTNNTALDLAGGDIVICEDIVNGAGPYEGWVCLWRGEAGPFVAQYSSRWREAGLSGAVGPNEVIDGELHAIARVRARLFAGFDESTMMRHNR